MSYIVAYSLMVSPFFNTPQQKPKKVPKKPEYVELPQIDIKNQKHFDHNTDIIKLN